MQGHYTANYNEGARGLDEYYGRDDEDVFVHGTTALQTKKKYVYFQNQFNISMRQNN